MAIGSNHTIWRRRQWHPTPVLLPGKSHGQRSLVGCSPQGRTESYMTERTQHAHTSAGVSCLDQSWSRQGWICWHRLQDLMSHNKPKAHIFLDPWLLQITLGFGVHHFFQTTHSIHVTLLVFFLFYCCFFIVCLFGFLLAQFSKQISHTLNPEN